MNITLEDFLPASPEIFLILGIFLMLLIGILKLDKSTKILEFFSPLLILGVICTLIMIPHSNAHAFNGTFIGDYFSYICKLFILMLVFFLFLIIPYTKRYDHFRKFEYIILILFATLGMLIMCSSIDFIVSFISLELLSLSLYVLVSLHRTDINASEAGMKYFIYGSISTAFFLFGISFLYGITGSTHFDNIATDIHTAVVQQKDITFAVIGLIFILCAFAFKLALAPLHFWLPDIFKGSSLTVILLLSSVPKFAEFALLLRILMHALPDLAVYWQTIFTILAISSLILGTFGALLQTKIKPFLGYSATANMGFVLLGASQGTEVGIASSFFYIALYTFTILSIMALLMFLEMKGHIIDKISEIGSVVKTHPLIAFGLSFSIISLAGIPFAPGFFAKIYVIYAAMFQEAYALTILAIICSVISTAYYLRFLKDLVIMPMVDVLKKERYYAAPILKITIISIFCIFTTIIFTLNLWIYITHQMTVALMH